jgi:restriction system protein
MPRRRGGGVLEDLFDTATQLPWWLGVTLAVVGYALLHHFAMAKVPPVVRLEDAGHALGKGMIKGLAGAGQYVIPPVLLMGAAASALGRLRRGRLFRDTTSGESDGARRPMSQPEPAAALVAEAPACPVCGRGMVQRRARRGPNAGGVFWGCPAYPQCRGRRAID